jgi:hypothetical protein
MPTRLDRCDVDSNAIRSPHPNCCGVLLFLSGQLANDHAQWRTGNCSTTEDIALSLLTLVVARGSLKCIGSFHYLSGVLGVGHRRRCRPRAGELILGRYLYSSIVRALAILGWSAVTNRTNRADVLPRLLLIRDSWVGHTESHESQNDHPLLFLLIDAMGA